MGDYIIIPIGVFLLLGLVFWLNTRLRQAKWAQRAAMQKQFIDRFGTAEELAAFLNNEHGRSIFEDSLTERKDQRLKILGGIRTGIVFLCLGIGFFLRLDDDATAIFPCTIFSSLGIGFILAAVISYRIAKNMNVVKDNQDSGDALPERSSYGQAANS